MKLINLEYFFDQKHEFEFNASIKKSLDHLDTVFYNLQHSESYNIKLAVTMWTYMFI